MPPKRYGAAARAGWLLWPRLRSVINAPRARHGRTPKRVFVFGALGVMFMLGCYFGAAWLFGAFLQAEFLAELLIRRTIGIVLLFFGGLLIFSNTVTAFSTFFAADDLPLLLSAPVPIGRLFLARFVDTWVQSSWMMLVFALPMMAAIGPVLGAAWWFYVVLPLVLLPLTLMCSAVGCLLTLALARIFPARRTQDVLIVLALLGFVGVYFAFRMADPERFLDPDGFGDLMSLIASLRQDGASLNPTEWTVDVLFGLIRGGSEDVLSEGMIGSALCLLTGAPALIALAAWLARGVYVTGFQIAQEGRSNAPKEGKKRRPARYSESLMSTFSRRDTLIFFRTTSQWTQLLLVAILVLVFVFNFKHFGALQKSGVLGPMGLFFTNVALGGLVITTIAVRFLYPAVSLEGLGVWAVQVAPVTAKELLDAKVRWGLWPLMGLGLALTGASNALVDLPIGLSLGSLVLTMLVTYALTGMGVGLGATTPRFDIDNPARIASGMGGVVFMLLGLTYLVVVSAMLAYPIYVARYAVSLNWTPSLPKIIGAAALLVGALGLTWAAHHVPLRMGIKALERG